MAFTLHELLTWMRDEQIEYTVRRADGTDVARMPSLELDRVSFDSRDVRAGVLFCAVGGEHTHGVRYLQSALAAGAPLALVEGAAPTLQGTPAWVVEVVDARAALNAAARGWLALHRPRVIAITGSNGKTTTKDLTRAALQGSVRVAASPGNRNSGWGLPAAVLGFEGSEDVLVLEMGASAPGEIARLCAVATPSIACITNVGPAHLEFFGDEAGVAQTKGALVESLPADGIAVLNRDDVHFDAFVARTSAPVVDFGRDPRAAFHFENVHSTAAGLALTLAGHSVELPLFGEHNASNVAAAAAMAQQLGVAIPVALERMRQVQLSPHRSRMIRVGGRVILDDCYNANPASVVAALDSLVRGDASARKLAVLGDMAELGAHAAQAHHDVIDHALRSGGIERLFVVGARMAYAARGFVDARLTGQAEIEPSSLARAILDASVPGDVVLIKASRSAALERVLESLEQACSEGPDAPGGPA